jgi:spermidine/putrescine transport system substrate-binding protein
LNGSSGSDRGDGLSRRSLLRRTGALTLGGAAAAGLAGCENTTTPVAAGGEGGGGRGILGDPTAGGPVDAVGIPLARRDYPVTLPRLGDAVRTGAKPERGGELRIYNYADYLNPAVLKAFGKQEGVDVRVTTFETLDEAFTKLSTGGLEFDVIFTTPDELSRLVGRRLVQPLNLDLVPNLRRTVWPEAADPFYDVGPRYTVPYTVYTTGVGWRNDKLRLDPADVDSVWDLLWNAERARGRVQLLNDPREAIGMGIMRRGSVDLNTEDQELIDAAVGDLRELDRRVRVKVAISAYETLPAGRIWAGQVWSGDMLNAVISYLPEGTSPDVLSYVYQEQGGPVFNDCICVASAAAKPVIAHRFLDHLLDEKVAMENFVGYVGYQPPLDGIDADRLFDDGVLPQNMRSAIVTREAYANGNAYLALTAEGRRRWDRAWTRFRTG